MRLPAWLSLTGLSDREFGERIGRTGEAVRLLKLGMRYPSRATITAIERETEGAVTANDFVERPTTIEAAE